MSSSAGSTILQYLCSPDTLLYIGFYYIRTKGKLGYIHFHAFAGAHHGSQSTPTPFSRRQSHFTLIVSKRQLLTCYPCSLNARHSLRQIAEGTGIASTKSDEGFQNLNLVFGDSVIEMRKTENGASASTRPYPMTPTSTIPPDSPYRLSQG